MSNRWAVETHPKRDQIIKEIIKGNTRKSIAEKYGLTQAAVSRYVKSKLRPAAAAEIHKSEEAAGKSLAGRVEHLISTTEKMLDSAADYLQDPENPDRFLIGPRAEEVEVSYLEVGDDNTPRRKKKPLQSLLDELQGVNGRNITDVTSKVTDPRQLLLEASRSLKEALTLLAKIEGSIETSDHVNLFMFPAWERLYESLLEAAGDDEEMRIRLAKRVTTVVAEHIGKS